MLKIDRKNKKAAKYMITKAGHNILVQNIKDFYKTAALAVSIVTNTTDGTSRNELTHRNNRNSQNYPNTRKSHDEYDYSYQLHSPRSHNTSSN